MCVKKQQLELEVEQRTVSKLGKEYDKPVLLSTCSLNFCAECIMKNAGLDESQAGIKISWRNINNLRYADDTTPKAEKELKSLLMRVKEESEKNGLILNIQKTKIVASISHHFMANRRGKRGSRDRFNLLGLQNH